MNLYQKQHGHTGTYIAPNFSYVSCDLPRIRVELSRERMALHGSTYQTTPWPLYDYDGKNFSLRVW